MQGKIKIPVLSSLLVCPLLFCCFFSESTVVEAQELNSAKKFKVRASRLVLGMPWEPVSFSPLLGIDSGSYCASGLVYEGLLEYNEQMKLVPALAESFSRRADGLTYKFKLRDNIRFSNGEKITADDVRNSLLLAKSPLSPFKQDYALLVDVKVLNSQEIELRLKEVCAPFLSRLAEVKILPGKILAQKDQGSAFLSRHPQGSGPFILASWNSGKELVFKRNPFCRRPPAVDTLIWRVVPDKNVMAIALARGEIDVAPLDARLWSGFLSKKAGRHSLEASVFNGNRTLYLGFNLSRVPWNNSFVRRAIASAIDRRLLRKTLYADLAEIPNTDVPLTSWCHSSETVPTNFNLGETTKLLRQAGYVYYSLTDKKNEPITNKAIPSFLTTGMPGIWLKNGQPLASRLHTIKDYEALALCVSDQLKQVGIYCQVEILEYTNLRRARLQKGAFDLVLWSRSSGPDPECSLVWKSKAPMNFCRLESSYLDGLIEAGGKAQTLESRKEAYKKIQDYLARELPWVFLLQPKLVLVHRADLLNTQRGQQKDVGLPWDNPLFNAAYWQLK